MVQYHKRLGRTFRLESLFATPVVYTTAPENLHIIYTAGKTFGIEPQRLPPMEFFCGKGFLTTDGSVWQQSRKRLKPTFSNANISDLSVLSRDIKDLFKTIPLNGSSFDLQPLLFTTFLNNSLHFLLGVDPSVDSEGAPCTADEFIEHLHSALRGTGLRVMLGRLRRLAPKKAYQQACRRAHEYLDFYVHRALEHNKKNGGTSTMNKQRSLIQGLAEQTDDKTYIRDQVLQGMMASQETTAVLISNAMFLLARNQQQWDTLRSEVLRLGEDLFTFDNLRGFTTLQNILSETLRLYPVFPMMIRCCLQDTMLPVGGGPNHDQPIFIPKGTYLQTSFFALHREESVFGPGIDEFRPERWLENHPGQWEYMAFGGGQRARLGREKVLFEAALVIARLAQNFERLESRDARQWKGMLRLTGKNANGCQIALYR
ncbi:cytochrome P450 [Byssothecium circinans]|uniref:Cytochrome P450 n=1 Tax=Byssothecium circinans TaxID=147558 RepID=A0A6A5TEQ2_9PLEO|nr:cytochrome P450 [Byssothecium circinans]